MLFAEARLRELKTAGEQRRVEKLGFAQRTHLQLHGLAQAVIGFAVIFNDHPTGMGIAHIQNQVDLNCAGNQRFGHYFDFRHMELFAQHGEQVEPVRLILEVFHRPDGVALGAVFMRRQILAEAFTQPAVNPGVIEKIADFIVTPGECETAAVADVVLRWRQQRSGVVVAEMGIKSERYAVGIPGAVGLIKAADLHPRPVIRPGGKGARRVKTQHRHRQPDAVQYAQRVTQQMGAFRFHHLRRTAVAGGQGEFIAGGEIVETQQRTVGGFTHEAPAVEGLLRRQTKVEELDAAVFNQGYVLLVIAQVCQHRIRRSLS